MFAIAFGVVSLAIYANVPAAAPDAAQTASIILLVAALAITPVCHLLGLGMGIAALFQPRDSKVLGILGLLLNSVFILAIVIWAFFAPPGSYR